MKINGLDPSTLANDDVLVLPRGEDNVVFRAKGLPNMDEFNGLCPSPTVPMKQTPQGIVPDVANADYKNLLTEYNRRQIAYLVVKSLEPSNIEWDSVKMDVPSSWANWEADLKSAGFSQIECNKVFELCWSVNQLDEAKLKKARESFLRGPQPASAQ